ncbi:MAG: hypothetical protein B7W99_00860 [Rhodospirillales bacterium 20-58-10]|nr:MAG: hypothetical protein B7W99_00860 [Rhodospirillales bacterium 20-58-10]
MSTSRLDDDEEVTFLIGEAVRRVLFDRERFATGELVRLAERVMAELVPVALTAEEFRRVDVGTGMYPPTFRRPKPPGVAP